MKEKQSPRITHISWGHMEVEGLGSGKDFKLYPGGGREWDWRETSTEHVPGIQPSDVQELLEKGSKVVVLSRGMQLMLRTCPETCSCSRTKALAYTWKKPGRLRHCITSWLRASRLAASSTPPAERLAWRRSSWPTG